MKIISWDDFTSGLSDINQPSSATVGVFDGVHRGHSYLLNKLNDNYIKEKVVFTFSKNPLESIGRGNFKGNIYTLNQKLDAFERAGVSITVLIDFSSDFSKLNGEYFINTILNHLDLRKIVLGKDFKCGVNNSTSSFDIFNMLKKKNIEVVIVNRQNYKNIPVSSSDIRDRIISGETDLLKELLPYGYAIDLSETEIFSENNYFFVPLDKIRQLLPEKTRFFINLFYENKTSYTEVFIDNRIIKWFNS